jgi:hypothetical protein
MTWGNHPYPLDNRQELGSGGRRGGRFNAGTQTNSIWTGRPPGTQGNGGPRVLALAMRAVGNRSFGVGDSASVDIIAECGNSFGGIIRREFTIGEGISADIRVGAFEHVRVVTASPVPDGCELYFCWVDELPQSSNEFFLINFVDYPVANTRIPLPEGCVQIAPESACQITWTLVSEGTTFVEAAAAGSFIPVKWGTLRANIATKFICRLRGF